MSKSLVNGKGDGLDEPVPFKTVLGLENVDNTADVDKPVSTAQQAAIDAAVAQASSVVPDRTRIIGMRGNLGYAPNSNGNIELINGFSFGWAKDTATAPVVVVRTSTGYARILNYDGTLEAVVGVGNPVADITVTGKIPVAPFDGLGVKRYTVWATDAGGIHDAGATLDLLEIGVNGLQTAFQGFLIDHLDGVAVGKMNFNRLSAPTVFIHQGQFLDLEEFSLYYSSAVYECYVASAGGASSTYEIQGNGGLRVCEITCPDLQELLFYQNPFLKVIDVSGCAGLNRFRAGNVDANPNFNSASLEDVIGLGDVTAWANNGAIPALDLRSCNLSAVTLDRIYTELQPVTGTVTIDVTGNPGVGGDDPSIATGKGWTVVGS